MTAAATGVSALLGVVFLGAGVPKLLRTTDYRRRIRHWRLPEGLLPAIGLVEVGGAALLLVGSAIGGDRPAIAGAALLIATAAGAVLTHVRIADPPATALPATVLGTLAALDIALLTM